MSSITYAIVFFFVLSLIGHVCHTVWKVKKQLHILQLHSYFNERYIDWLYKKRLQVFGLKELEPLISLIGMFFSTPLVVLVLFALIYFRLFLSLPNVLEKKPFVFTARATRLFIVNLVFLAVLYLGLVAALWGKGERWFGIAMGFLVVYNFFVPFILVLANLLLSPLEKLIQYQYSRKAYFYISTLTNLKIVGITGSFGKTTTKYILTEILRHKFNTLKTPGSYNTTMGITKVICSELKPIHDIFVVEMSAKKSGDIKEICDLVRPQYGLITAIGEQHLETFGTLDNIKKTKNELINSLPSHGVAFFNMDDVNCRELVSATKCRIVKYGIEVEGLDYRISDLTINEYGSNFTITRTRDNSRMIFQTQLLGKHNIYNILGAVAVASELGIELAEMVYSLRQVVAVPHRLELKRMGGGVTFIDDAFNSNPVGSKMALEVLAQIGGKRKIIITPGMVELGVKEDEYNERLGENIAQVCNYVILVGEQQTLALQRGLKTKQYPSDKLFIAVDFAAAKKHLDQLLQAGDVVLFENDLPDNY